MKRLVENVFLMRTVRGYLRQRPGLVREPQNQRVVRDRLEAGVGKQTMKPLRSL